MHEIRMCIIDTIIHNCCCNIFTCISKCPSFFDIKIKSRFATSLANIFLIRLFILFLLFDFEEKISYQIPLILKIGISWGLILRKSCFEFSGRTIATFDTNMWNLMNSSFNLKIYKSSFEKEIIKFYFTSSCR